MNILRDVRTYIARLELCPINAAVPVGADDTSAKTLARAARGDGTDICDVLAPLADALIIRTRTLINLADIREANHQAWYDELTWRMSELSSLCVRFSGRPSHAMLHARVDSAIKDIIEATQDHPVLTPLLQ